MLTRPGSRRGPEWMSKLGSSPDGFRRIRKAILGDQRSFRRVTGCRDGRRGQRCLSPAWPALRAYNSPVQIAGMPLLSMGRTAHGVIAYGGVAAGIVAIGGVSAGVVAFGGISVRVFSFGALSLGVVVQAALAVGWRAVGALALGDASFGALAIGRYACGPGIAFGYHEASGKQKESLFG